MGRGIDNYFLILELNFVNIETDIAVIEKRVKEKAKFWNNNSEKGRLQQKYRQYNSQIIDIGKVMKTESLREAEAKDAHAFVKGILKEELKFFAGKTEIEQSAANSIMEKTGLWAEMFTELTKLKIVKETKKDAHIIDPNPQPKRLAKFRNYDVYLDVLHKRDLYDFLSDGKEVMGLKTLDGEELIEGFSNKLKEQVKHDKSEEGSATKTLCAACEEVFDPKNTDLRTNYDEYLIWKERDEVITRIDKYSGTSKQLDALQQNLFTNELTQIMRNREDAIEIFQNICLYKGIKIGGMKSNSDENSLVCGYCYAMVDIAHGEKKCSSCGKDLYIKCPQCQKEVQSSLKVCGHCGFTLKNLQKTEVLCDFAEAAIVNMDFDTARSNLAKAKWLLKGYHKIAPLEKELVAKETIFSKEMKQMNLCVSKKEFYKAKEILKNLQRQAPTAKIPGDILIENSVKEAEQLYKLAISETLEDKLIKICSQISSICKDYPGIDSLIVKYRPKPPTNVKIICDTTICTNTLTWNKSLSSGEISYKIIRKENTAAASMTDPSAQEIGEAGIPKFVDTKLKAGVDYYYSVYAIRAGVASESVHVRATNLAEIKITNKEEGDRFVRVEWMPLEKSVRVDVHRFENESSVKSGNGKKINIGSNYFLDESVKNDKEYFYHLIAVYYSNGKEFATKGITVSLIPTSLPEPVSDLTLKTIDENLFEANWTSNGDDKVSLYYVDSRLSLKYGDIVNISKVRELLKPVDSVTQSSGVCRFRIHDNKKYSIIPVTVKGNTAVIGEKVIAVKIEKIKLKKIEIVNTDLRIDIEWPEDAISVLAVYGQKGYAKNLGDRKGKNSRNISKKQFNADSSIVLKDIEKKDYYITLYSVCKVNGELVYSDGTQLLFSNRPKPDIHYTIRVKGFLSKEVEVEFTSSASEFHLPEVELVSKQGGIPVYVHSGMVIERIEEQDVIGSYKLIFPVKNLSRDSYIKPFFVDENVNDEINLRPVYGTNFKVN